jgi:hypothetical protein
MGETNHDGIVGGSKPVESIEAREARKKVLSDLLAQATTEDYRNELLAGLKEIEAAEKLEKGEE